MPSLSEAIALSSAASSTIRVIGRPAFLAAFSSVFFSAGLAITLIEIGRVLSAGGLRGLVGFLVNCIALACVHTLPAYVVCPHLRAQERASDSGTAKDETMISDQDAITQAQARYAADCERLRVKPRELIGEVANAEGKRFVTLFDAGGRLAAIYRVINDHVVDLDGAELARVRPRLQHRKVRG